MSADIPAHQIKGFSGNASALWTPKRRVAYIYTPETSCTSLGNFFKPTRAAVTYSLCRAYGLLNLCTAGLFVPQPLSFADLALHHTPEYLAFLRRATPIDEPSRQNIVFNCGGDGSDCPVFSDLWEYSRRAAGGSVAAGALLASGAADVAIHWGGGLHHAKANQGSGFCYVNDIVLCILRMLRTFPRVLYIDIDVHHGDGVEEAFYTSDRVVTLSLHRYGNFFPGSGSPCTDCGSGDGYGFSLNVPLDSGVSDAQYSSVFDVLLAATVERFQPSAVVLQCGGDSLQGDRLGPFKLSILGHGHCVAAVLRLGIPTVLLGGGGYTMPNVARAWTYATSLAVGYDEGELPDALPPFEFSALFQPRLSLYSLIIRRKWLLCDPIVRGFARKEASVMERLGLAKASGMAATADWTIANSHMSPVQRSPHGTPKKGDSAGSVELARAASDVNSSCPDSPNTANNDMPSDCMKVAEINDFDDSAKLVVDVVDVAAPVPADSTEGQDGSGGAGDPAADKPSRKPAEPELVVYSAEAATKLAHSLSEGNKLTFSALVSALQESGIRLRGNHITVHPGGKTLAEASDSEDYPTSVPDDAPAADSVSVGCAGGCAGAATEQQGVKTDLGYGAHLRQAPAHIRSVREPFVDVFPTFALYASLANQSLLTADDGSVLSANRLVPVMTPPAGCWRCAARAGYEAVVSYVAAAAQSAAEASAAAAVAAESDAREIRGTSSASPTTNVSTYKPLPRPSREAGALSLAHHRSMYHSLRPGQLCKECASQARSTAVNIALRPQRNPVRFPNFNTPASVIAVVSYLLRGIAVLPQRSETGRLIRFAGLSRFVPWSLLGVGAASNSDELVARRGDEILCVRSNVMSLEAARDVVEETCRDVVLEPYSDDQALESDYQPADDVSSENIEASSVEPPVGRPTSKKRTRTRFSGPRKR